jgi:hypothetical protein
VKFLEPYVRKLVLFFKLLLVPDFTSVSALYSSAAFSPSRFMRSLVNVFLSVLLLTSHKRDFLVQAVKHRHSYVRFQVLTAASMMFRIVFWDVLPCKIIPDDGGSTNL